MITKDTEQHDLSRDDAVLLSLAGKEKRFLNFLIDYMILGAAFTPFTWLFMGESMEQMMKVQMELASNSSQDPSEVFPMMMEVYRPMFLIYLGMLLLYPLYYVLMEKLAGRTLGKMATSTYVVRLSSEEPISWGQSIGRTLCRYIPFEPLSILFSSKGRGWHDTLTNTYVIDRDKWNKLQQ